MEYQFPEIADNPSLLVQVLKIKEETREVEEEQAKIEVNKVFGEPIGYDNLIMETLDLVHACETLLRKLPVPKSQIDKAHKQVISKNRARHYYKEGSR